VLARCRPALRVTPKDLGVSHVVIERSSGLRVLVRAQDNVLPHLVA